MGDSVITLNQFFDFKAEKIPQDRLSSIESTERLTLLRRSITGEARQIRWPVAFDEIMEKVKDILNIDLADIMVGAWKKRQEISKYADTQKYPPGDTFLVPLFEHTVVSKHTPRIEVLVNGMEVGRILFEIDVALTLEGAILRIDGGSILGVSTGRCRGKGAIKCEGVTLLDKEPRPFQLPGSLPFDPAIPIG